MVGFVNNSMHEQLETNDIVASHELLARRNKQVCFENSINSLRVMGISIIEVKRPLSLLCKGSASRRVWTSPPVPTERYELRPCLCVFVARFDRRIFFTIRQKRIRRGGALPR